MRHLAFFLLFTAISISSAEAGGVGFVIEGNSGIDDNTILGVIGEIACTSADSACIDLVCRAVARLYWDSGYLDADVACGRSASGGEAARIAVTEGDLRKLGSVRIAGAGAFGEDRLEAAFDDLIGAPFSPAGLEAAISRLLELYDAGGYPLAVIQPELVSLDRDRLTVQLRIDEGPRARLGGVEFPGAERTRHSSLLAETGLVAGEPYDGSKVEAARRRLLDLRVFERVSDPEIAFNGTDTTVTVGFAVDEARTTTFQGLAAYAPGGANDKFVGSFDIGFWNLGGTLRRLRVLWDKPGSGKLTWSVYYREPRILSYPIALEARVSSDVIDTSYASRRLWADAVYVGEPGFEIGAGGFIGSTKDRTAGGGEGNFGERGLSFSLRYEGRDDPINPRAGLLVSISNEVASLDFENAASTDRTQSKLSLAAEYVLSFTRRSVLASEVRFDGVFTSAGRIPEAHRVRVGGMRSLRGYPEAWFSVEEALVLRLEARYLLGLGSRVYGFADGAALKDETRSLEDLRDAPVGYGVGFVGGSASGLVRVEIALGRDDTWSEAKLHFGLLQRF